jgi:hypothetical protein
MNFVATALWAVGKRLSTAHSAVATADPYAQSKFK